MNSLRARLRSWLLVSTMLLPVTATVAAPASAPAADVPAAAAPPSSEDIVVTARRLDAARDSILPSLGASNTVIDAVALANQPQGADRGLQQVLLQIPGVAEDSYGEIHVRNEHGNVQYRINGIIVPESISGFGQTIDTRLAKSVSLLTGTLPAQYGYRTAAVVNVTSQSGSFDDGGDVGFYGGSHGTLQPSATLKGSTGGLNYFASGSYLQNDLGVENPTPSRRAIHDRTAQYRAFAYVSQILSDTSRLSAFGGTAIGHFQIPDNPGQLPLPIFVGTPHPGSAALDSNQTELTHYGVVAYQYSGDALNVQVAPFVRFSRTSFTPDPSGGDVVFNGYSDQSRLSSLAAGVQADASYKLSDRHTLRAGLFFQNERTRSSVLSQVLPVGDDGLPTSTQTKPVLVTGGETGQLYGLYMQDEWTLSPELTINAGVRFDAVRAYTHEQQLSPRLNLVYQPNKATSFHAGYARDFTPPPQELIGASTVAQFVGTTKASDPQSSAIIGAVKAEREHYFDAGVLQNVGSFTIGVDSYYKLKTNLLDEGSSASRWCCRRSTTPAAGHGASSSARPTSTARCRPMPTSHAGRKRAATSSRASISSAPPSSPISPRTRSTPITASSGPARRARPTRSTTARHARADGGPDLQRRLTLVRPRRHHPQRRQAAVVRDGEHRYRTKPRRARRTERPVATLRRDQRGGRELCHPQRLRRRCRSAAIRGTARVLRRGAEDVLSIGIGVTCGSSVACYGRRGG